MFEQVLAQQNPHWSGESYDNWIARSCFDRLIEYLATGQVVAITGVRRAGKSTLIRLLIEHLIHVEKVPAHRILFLNLEHPYLSPYRDDRTVLQRLYDDYLKMMGPTGEVYVFLDEVQFVRDWPVFVKAHHETKKIRFVVTGSNAAMLSSDMVTLLSGRSLPLEVFPFSMRELAVSRNIQIDRPAAIAKETPKLKRLLDEFLEYGGFPTVALSKQRQAAFEILGAHARTVLLQDVAPRLGIRKPVNLEQLYVYLVSNISKLFSYASLSKLFDLSDKSIKEYLQAIQDAHLIYEVDRFSYSLKTQMRNPKKVYAIDTGQAKAMGFKFSANQGRLLENLIFIDLKRLGLEVYYYKTERDREVDFVVKQGTDLSLIQIAWDLSDPDTREREVQALTEAKKELGCERATIITLEPVRRYAQIDGIRMLAVIDYLLLKPEERRHCYLQ